VATAIQRVPALKGRAIAGCAFLAGDQHFLFDHFSSPFDVKAVIKAACCSYR
jgi:hypothetical protein